MSSGSTWKLLSDGVRVLHENVGELGYLVLSVRSGIAVSRVPPVDGKSSPSIASSILVVEAEMP